MLSLRPSSSSGRRCTACPSAVPLASRLPGADAMSTFSRPPRGSASWPRATRLSSTLARPSGAPSGACTVVHSSLLRDGSSSAALRSRSCERSEEHTSELQSLMRLSYAVFCLIKKKHFLELTNLLNTHCTILTTHDY